ncbi:TRAPPC6B [Symbiodinium microadriaticum]|nr:TRAPPC6B [Symbiodinium microadriaticum]
MFFLVGCRDGARSFETSHSDAATLCTSEGAGVPAELLDSECGRRQLRQAAEEALLLALAERSLTLEVLESQAQRPVLQRAEKAGVAEELLHHARRRMEGSRALGRVLLLAATAMADLQIAAAYAPVGERPPLLGTGVERTAEREVSHSLYLLLHAEMVAAAREQGLEQAEAKLRSTGFATGLRLITRLTASKIPITTERMVMKFVCKDLWTCLFKKPASRLQVDKQGRYLIQDTGFRWFESFPILPAESARAVSSSSEETSILSELSELTTLHLALPCGLLQGALFGLGLERRILVEAAHPPSVTFTVAKAASAVSSTEAAAVSEPSSTALV